MSAYKSPNSRSTHARNGFVMSRKKMPEISKDDVFLLEYQVKRNDGIVNFNRMLIKLAPDSDVKDPYFNVILSLSENNTIIENGMNRDNMFIINHYYDLFKNSHEGLVTEDVKMLTKLKKSNDNNIIIYNLTYMPIDTYMFKDDYYIPFNNKKEWLQTMSNLIDKNGTRVKIPIDVWTYIMEFLIEYPKSKSNSKIVKKGGKRTRSAKKNRITKYKH